MKLFFVSLGCDKNLVDSEKMLALLASQGIEITADPSEAEAIVVNTCGFIQDAKEESIETILEMAQYKETGRCRALVVAGCLAQRYFEEMSEEIPEVDAVVGTAAYDRIVEAVTEALEGKKPRILEPLDRLPAGITGRVASSGGYVSYLKIAEGCDKRCTYCIIPYLRGSYRSVPVEELLEEAGLLAENGTKELILVAQETTVYGVDLYGEKKLPELLKKLCRIEGIQWIRILYSYPEEITEELLAVMAEEPKICHYLDLPIQHCNDEVLRRMGRKTTKEQILGMIERIREYMPDAALRTTLISGFPGETKEQHEECVAFVKQAGFDRLGVFPYSPEEGTPAASWEGAVDDEVKRAWADELMEASEQVVFRQNEKWTGQEMDVIVDGYLPEDEVYVGRTYRDAPDVDGCVFFRAADEIVSGTVLTVRITEAAGYDLIGEVKGDTA